MGMWIHVDSNQGLQLGGSNDEREGITYTNYGEQVMRHSILLITSMTKHWQWAKEIKQKCTDGGCNKIAHK